MVASRLHVSRRWKIATLAITGCLGVGACIAAYGWYDERYAWPRKIQIEILGEEIVTHESLRSYEASAAYGQGIFRWTYVAPSAPGSRWMKHCPSQVVEGCEFTKAGSPGDQVKTSVSYKDGVVTIEEWWM